MQIFREDGVRAPMGFSTLGQSLRLVRNHLCEDKGAYVERGSDGQATSVVTRFDSMDVLYEGDAAEVETLAELVGSAERIHAAWLAEQVGEVTDEMRASARRLSAEAAVLMLVGRSPEEVLPIVNAGESEARAQADLALQTLMT